MQVIADETKGVHKVTQQPCNISSLTAPRTASLETSVSKDLANEEMCRRELCKKARVYYHSDKGTTEFQKRGDY
jgi:hypothetical protein